MSPLVSESLPPSPFFLLRGHASEVQCLEFSQESLSDSLLSNAIISGDADGFIIIWSTKTFRPLAIWKAHDAALLTVKIKEATIYTHGRDNKIHLWDIVNWDNLSKELPIAIDEIRAKVNHRPKPFMICTLDVNALNFCQMSICSTHESGLSKKETLVAVPGLIGSEYLDIYVLPAVQRLATRIIAHAPAKGRLGNVMAVDLKYPLLAVAYENGAVALFTLDVSAVDRDSQRQDGKWRCLKVWCLHRDAVLSVIINTEHQEIYSCGIDSRFIRYLYKLRGEPEDISPSEPDYKIVETKHSGQQCMRMRSDGKLLGTAGWDSYARIYTVPKAKQVAVLSCHKGAVNSIAFRDQQAGIDNLIALGGKDAKISLWNLY